MWVYSYACILSRSRKYAHSKSLRGCYTDNMSIWKTIHRNHCFCVKRIQTGRMVQWRTSIFLSCDVTKSYWLLFYIEHQTKYKRFLRKSCRNIFQPQKYYNFKLFENMILLLIFKLRISISCFESVFSLKKLRFQNLFAISIFVRFNNFLATSFFCVFFYLFLCLYLGFCQKAIDVY